MLFISFCVNALNPLSIYPNHFCLISLHFRYRHFPFSHSPSICRSDRLRLLLIRFFPIELILFFNLILHFIWLDLWSIFKDSTRSQGEKKKQNGRENKNSLMLCQTLISIHFLSQDIFFFFLVFKFSFF